MTRFIKIVICMVITLIPFFCVNAALLDEVRLTDSQNGIFVINGSLLPESRNNRIVSVIMTSEIANENGYNGKDIVHMGGAEVSYGGKYSYSFKFSGTSGRYVLYVVENGEAAERQLSYSDYDDLLKLVEDITKISGTELTAALREHSLALDIDIKDITSADDVNILIKRIKEANITAPEDIKAVVANVKREIKLITDIYTATVWNQISGFLDETADITNISLTSYNYLSNDNKKVVSLALMGKKFKDSEDIKDAFLKAISGIPTPPPQTGGGGGGGTSSERPYSGGLIGIMPGPAEPISSDSFFTDIENSKWAEEAILFLAVRQIISGDGNKNFMPDNFVKREEAAKMIVLASKQYNEFAASGFSDVGSDNWAFPYISSAYEGNILNGISETEFGYGAYVTREDLAVLLYRMLIKKGVSLTNNEAEFTDFDSISEYARDAVLYLAGEGVISGMGDGSFSSKSYATRAQTAKLIYEAVVLGGFYDGE